MGGMSTGLVPDLDEGTPNQRTDLGQFPEAGLTALLEDATRGGWCFHINMLIRLL